MKKTVSVLLAVLVCLCISLCALAAGEPTFEVSSATAEAGETVDLKITIKNNPGIASAKLSVSFDSELKLENVTFGNIGGQSSASEKLVSPVILNWFSPTTELKKDAEYATLSFTVLKEAKSGAHKVSISYDPEDVYNANEKNVSFKTVNGTVTVSGGFETTSSEVSKSDDGEVPTVISSASEDDGDTENVASTATQEGIITVGASDGGGEGEYAGEEILEFEDESGNPTDGITSTPKKNNASIWIFAGIAVVLISGGVAAFVIIKKRRVPKTSDKEK